MQKVEGALALEGTAIKNGTPLINKPNLISVASESAIPKIIFGEGNFTITKLLEAGKSMDRQGLTKAGRGLAKHGGRGVTSFPKALGNPAEINLQGEIILRDPNKTILKNQLGDIKIFAADGKGEYFRKDGTFDCFRTLCVLKIIHKCSLRNRLYLDQLHVNLKVLDFHSI